MAFNRGSIEGDELDELDLPTDHERSPLGDVGLRRDEALGDQEGVGEEHDPEKMRQDK